MVLAPSSIEHPLAEAVVELLVRRCDNEVVELVRQLVAENSTLHGSSCPRW
jgi:hypothetical protein